MAERTFKIEKGTPSHDAPGGTIRVITRVTIPERKCIAMVMHVPTSGNDRNGQAYDPIARNIAAEFAPHIITEGTGKRAKPHEIVRHSNGEYTFHVPDGWDERAISDIAAQYIKMADGKETTPQRAQAGIREEFDLTEPGAHVRGRDESPLKKILRRGLEGMVDPAQLDDTVETLAKRISRTFNITGGAQRGLGGAPQRDMPEEE